MLLMYSARAGNRLIPVDQRSHELPRWAPFTDDGLWQEVPRG